MSVDLTLTEPDSDLHVVFKNNDLLLFFKEDNIKHLIKRVPGWDFNKKYKWTWSIPGSSLRLLEEHAGNFIIWKSKEKLLKEQKMLQQEEETLENVLKRIKPEFHSDNLKIKPYHFQKIGINWILEEKGKKAKVKGGILADLMGLGKTFQSLSASIKLKEEGKIKKCLIITPATLKNQWAQEIDKITYEDSIIIEGNQKKRLELFEKIRKENIFYTIINYELLYQRKRIKKKGENNEQELGDYVDLNEIIKNNYDMVIIDEAHRFKNPDTETAKAIRMITQPKYRLLLTGTPLEKELSNVFQLIDYVSPNILGDEKMTFQERRQLFEDLFLITSWNPFTYFFKEKIIVGVKNEDILNRRISPYILRRTSEQELPQEIVTNVVIPWVPEQFILFKKADDMLENINKELMSIDNEKEKEEKETKRKLLGNIKQLIANEPRLLFEFNSPLAKKITGKKKKLPKSLKLQRLIEMGEQILGNTNEKMVIFTHSEKMTRIIEKEFLILSEKMANIKGEKNRAFAFEVAMYTGAVQKKCKLKDVIQEKGKNCDENNISCEGCPFFNDCDSRIREQWKFQNDDNVRVIICNDAANYGVNLQRGKYLINYDLPGNFATYSQRNGRIRRLGSEHDRIYIYNLLIKDFEEKKFEKLMKQKDVFDYYIENNEEENKAIEEATKRFLNNEFKNNI